MNQLVTKRNLLMFNKTAQINYRSTIFFHKIYKENELRFILPYFNLRLILPPRRIKAADRSTISIIHWLWQYKLRKITPKSQMLGKSFKTCLKITLSPTAYFHSLTTRSPFFFSFSMVIYFRFFIDIIWKWIHTIIHNNNNSNDMFFFNS